VHEAILLYGRIIPVFALQVKKGPYLSCPEQLQIKSISYALALISLLTDFVHSFSPFQQDKLGRQSGEGAWDLFKR
jgi:hypothetical protein